MLETFEAVVFPGNEPIGFSTPEQALAHAHRVNRDRHNSAVALCRQQIIRSVDWRDGAFLLTLDNGKLLHFHIAGSAVEVAARDDVPGEFATGSRAPEIVRLTLGSLDFHWKRGDLMRSLVGRVFQGIQATEKTLFIYVAGVGILYVSILMERAAHAPFLFWNPSD